MLSAEADGELGSVLRVYMHFWARFYCYSLSAVFYTSSAFH